MAAAAVEATATAGAEEAARAALARLVAERREDYAGLSRLLGRNPAYIQQYVKRGTPRRLAEDDRRTLARYFAVPEALLGGPPEKLRTVAADRGGAARREADLVAVPAHALTASAGPGSLEEEGAAGRPFHFAPAELRRLGATDLARLSLIRVEGESMLPTLGPGDDILVDAADGPERLRDGVYVLRVDDALLVKRLVLAPDGRLAIRSDNRSYPSWEDIGRSRLHVVGRVIWAGKRL